MVVDCCVRTREFTRDDVVVAAPMCVEDASVTQRIIFEYGLAPGYDTDIDVKQVAESQVIVVRTVREGDDSVGVVEVPLYTVVLDCVGSGSGRVFYPFFYPFNSPETVSKHDDVDVGFCEHVFVVGVEYVGECTAGHHIVYGGRRAGELEEVAGNDKYELTARSEEVNAFRYKVDVEVAAFGPHKWGVPDDGIECFDGCG
jgi:hypothetical protein